MFITFVETGDPFIKPDWRWTNVKEASAVLKVLEYFRGKETPEFLEYVAQLRTTGDFHDRDARTARKIYEQNGLLRSEIEARIVAGETDEQIATKIGTSSQVIKLYESIFFFVRPYIGTGWLVMNTIGLDPGFFGFKNNDLRPLWCKYALAGGPVIVDAFIDAFKRNKRTRDSDSLAVYLRADNDVPLIMKSTVALDVIPRDRNGDIWRIELRMRLQKLKVSPLNSGTSLAMEKLHQDIVNVGLMALQRAKLPTPPNWKKRSKKKRADASQFPSQLAALQELLT